MRTWIHQIVRFEYPEESMQDGDTKNQQPGARAMCFKDQMQGYVLQMEGAELAFRDLSFEVTLKNGSKKKILSNVSGAIQGVYFICLIRTWGYAKMLFARCSDIALRHSRDI